MTSTHRITTGSLADERRIDGTIVHPHDPAWDAARQAWNLAVDQRPAMVAFPESESDVQALVRMAGRRGLDVVAQGTGHGAAAYGDLARCMLIRTTRMQHLSINGTSCRAAAGVLWGEVAVQASRRGLAALAGSSPDVGVVGYTLGGGIGWLARPHGLAANRVRAVDLVDGDGNLRRVDAVADPELFWALRGGGGGMGVVTEIEFDLLPVGAVYAGTLAWPAEEAPAVLRAWADWTSDLDERITSIIRFLSLPPIPDVPEVFRGRRMLTLGMAAVEDLDRAEAAADRMRSVAAPELDAFDRMPPAGLVRLHGDPEGPTPGMSHHGLLSTFDEDVAGAFESVAGVGTDSSLVSVEIRHLGGAAGRPVADGGVIDRIDAPYVANAVGMASDPEQRDRTWRDLTSAIGAFGPWHAGSYLNFSERPAADVFDAETTRRLGDVKRRVDPDQRFAVRSDLPITAER